MKLDDGLLHSPFCGSAQAYLMEARRLMNLAAVSSRDRAPESYQRRAYQMYQEARIMDREVADRPAYAVLQHIWIDLMSIPSA